MQPTASLKQIHCGLDFGREVESTSGGSVIHYEGEASTPEWVIEGWMLGPPELVAHGVRIRLGSEVIVAKRKQLRPDVMRLYPERAEALHSGFKASVVFRPGKNLMVFQFKDETGNWIDFMACTARLSRFWKLRQALGSRAGFNAYEAWFSSHMALSKKQIGEQRELSKSLPTRPTMSLLIRVGKRDDKDLRQTIKSVLEQTYGEWQIHLVVGGQNHHRI